jgi:hypothetical protein
MISEASVWRFVTLSLHVCFWILTNAYDCSLNDSFTRKLRLNNATRSGSLGLKLAAGAGHWSHMSFCSTGT